REVVRATCTLAQQLAVGVVAEFVENDRQVMLLEALGIDYLQGYGLSPPLPLDEYLSRIDFLADKWQAQFDQLPVLSSE
ncbi:EAL domain-containing protein, partial [Pseudoalteromonas sp. SIMBA_153]